MDVTIIVKVKNTEGKKYKRKYTFSSDFLKWQSMGILYDPTVLINMHCKEKKRIISEWLFILPKSYSHYKIPKFAYQMFYINDNEMATAGLKKLITYQTLDESDEKQLNSFNLSLNENDASWKMAKVSKGVKVNSEFNKIKYNFKKLVKEYNQKLIDPYMYIGKKEWTETDNLKKIMTESKSYEYDLCSQIVLWNRLDPKGHLNDASISPMSLVSKMLLDRTKDRNDKSYVIGSVIYRKVGANKWPLLISLNCKGKCKSAHAETRGLLFLSYIQQLSNSNNPIEDMLKNPWCTTKDNKPNMNKDALQNALASYNNHYIYYTDKKQTEWILYSTLLPCYMCFGTVSNAEKGTMPPLIEYIDHDNNVSYMDKDSSGEKVIEGVNIKKIYGENIEEGKYSYEEATLNNEEYAKKLQEVVKSIKE